MQAIVLAPLGLAAALLIAATPVSATEFDSTYAANGRVPPPVRSVPSPNRHPRILRVPSQFPTLNAALDEAEYGDEVLVAPGTYTDYDTRRLWTGSNWFTLNSCAFMPDGVSLISAAGPEATTIDMADQGLGLSWPVAFYRLGSSDSRVSGFTITGAPFGNPGIRIMYCGKVTVENCILRDLDRGKNKAGGGISSFESMLDVFDSRFVNCHAGAGGGAIVHIDKAITIARCVFTRCSNVAIYVSAVPSQAGWMSVSDCVFEDNHGRGGGALAAANWNDLFVTGCVFRHNIAEEGGGAGIWLGGSTSRSAGTSSRTATVVRRFELFGTRSACSHRATSSGKTRAATSSIFGCRIPTWLRTHSSATHPRAS